MQNDTRSIQDAPHTKMPVAEHYSFIAVYKYTLSSCQVTVMTENYATLLVR